MPPVGVLYFIKNTYLYIKALFMEQLKFVYNDPFVIAGSPIGGAAFSAIIGERKMRFEAEVNKRLSAFVARINTCDGYINVYPTADFENFPYRVKATEEILDELSEAGLA